MGNWLPLEKLEIMRNLLFFVMMAFCLSCDKNGLFDAGKTVIREIQLQEDFSLIEVENIFDITLVQDTVNKILVTCGENLQKFVDIHIQDKVLHLNQHTTNDWSRPYNKIKLECHFIQMPGMNIREPISLSTIGTLTIPNFYIVDWGTFCEMDVNLNVDNCYLDMSDEDFGLFKLKGKCAHAYFRTNGSAIVRADSLVTTFCKVDHHGWGDVYVNFTSKLEVSLQNTGNIYYIGDPLNIVIDKQSSDGQLIRLNK